jgi:carbon-monoxide dehydrogenase small subunit
MQFNINGLLYSAEVDVRRTLLEVLRENFGLMGTKKGCNEGECGACTVLMEGKPVLSCLVLAAEAQNKEIETIEGLVRDGQLHPLQRSFIEHGALQCGFCTPGMIMAAKALLDKNSDPAEEDVKWALAGNICRCGNYRLISRAVLAAGEKLRNRRTK